MKNTKSITHASREHVNDLKAHADEAGHSATEVLDELRERVSVAQDRLADFYVGAKKQAVASAKRTDTFVRDYPYQSLAIILGIGLLAGVLIGRRTR